MYKPLINLSDCEKFERCYPISGKYYNNLFEGTSLSYGIPEIKDTSLRFEKIAEFSSNPKIPFINIKVNDQFADESFTVYDHPRIFIFKKE